MLHEPALETENVLEFTVLIKMPGWMKHKLESRLPGEISITSDMQMTPPVWQKVKRNWRASWWKWKRRVKSWLKTQHSKNEDHGIWFHHFMANKYETMETVTDFIFLGSKVTADGDCSYEIKRSLLHGRKIMTNLDSILKSRDITLPTKACLVKGMVFPVVMCGCESWTIEKAEFRRIDAFELWCWRRLLRVSWTARRSHQFNLNEISPEYSLEGLMLKLQLQYFGHLMGRTDSLEKTLMLGKIGGRRRRGQRMRCLDGIEIFDPRKGWTPRFIPSIKASHSRNKAKIWFQEGREGDFPGGSVGKESSCSVGELGSIPGSRRSPGEGNGNPLQYSCLENPMDRRADQRKT